MCRNEHVGKISKGLRGPWAIFSPLELVPNDLWNHFAYAVRRAPSAVRRGRQYLNNHWADLDEILCEHTCRYLVDAELFIFSILSF